MALKLTPSGVDTVLYSFVPLGQLTVSALDASLIEGNDGNFYSVSIDGGASNQGTVVRVSTAGVVTLLHSFGSSGDGIQPNAGLILGSDGNLYGTTADGGANNAGAVFKLTPDGTETILYSFKGKPSDGNFPYAGLFQDSDGNFYGTTEHGGENDLGVISSSRRTAQRRFCTATAAHRPPICYASSTYSCPSTMRSRPNHLI